MKIPKRPPDIDTIFKKVKPSKRFELIKNEAVLSEAEGKYYHWDTLRHLKPPKDLSSDEWWLAIKTHRLGGMKKIPLVDKEGEPFLFNIPDLVAKELHEIDLGAGGALSLPEQIINTQTRNQYIVRSLIQEAITSSQLEGAATTREVAKEMLKSGRPPRDVSERMILNNYLTMQQIQLWKDLPLDPDLVFEIHRKVTDQTLDKEGAAGRFRKESEVVQVCQEVTGEVLVLHDPPKASELPKRLKAMCGFANGKTPSYFVHPVIRAIILHFWLAYDHPFYDGNGRTARALFYWAMLRQNYWLFEYISISEVLLRAPTQYAMAFLHTETDGNDLTYFVIHQAKVIQKAIQALHQYVETKTRELRETEFLLTTGINLNYRQQTLIAHALRNPGARYSVEAHKTSHHIAYDTARKDLQDLQKKGLLDVHKQGKAFIFIAPIDLHSRVEKNCR